MICTPFFISVQREIIKYTIMMTNEQLFRNTTSQAEHQDNILSMVAASSMMTQGTEKKITARV